MCFLTGLQEAARYVNMLRCQGSLTSIASADPTRFYNFTVLYGLAAEGIEVLEIE